MWDNFDRSANADGSFKRKAPPDITGGLLATNLGNEADTIAALLGQIADAYYGESGILIEWRELLTKRELIDHFTETLLQRGPLQ